MGRACALGVTHVKKAWAIVKDTGSGWKGEAQNGDHWPARSIRSRVRAAARCTAFHGVGSNAEPVVTVMLCSIPVT